MAEITSIPSYFQLHSQPLADPDAMIHAGPARFTLLTSRLIRMEYAPTESSQQPVFEDHASQAFWQRRQPVPPHTVRQAGGWVEITTDYLHLRYQEGRPFSPQTLSIELNGLETTWHYGDANRGNLGGTARTLDKADGPVPLEPGLVSRQGWVLVDDSLGLVFGPDGWLTPRQTPPGSLDLYFFGYGADYQACLADFCRVSGPVPVLPRWALGNWWSRYWEYSQQELHDLMLAFQAHQTPLSVCIIDMDWHMPGWTGYTWNRNLFPDPPALLNFMHSLGLKVGLNLHPATGVGAHEEAYAKMAAAVGIDPATKQRIAFDLDNPVFMNAYFDILHHPQEAQGIDFWWMDWQQGNPTKTPGLNLLWWINHLHFYDIGREERIRPFIFSRWGGLGNHRYPIGFSGDTVVSWQSLAFQPYFTATAANVNYGWWSHDIGGHMAGIEDVELYTRWVQFGVFSPIFRLHSTKNPFHERRPWGWDAETFEIVRHFMQLRHALIPYLYSMSWRNHHQGIPLVRPMYHLYPQTNEAYACPNQYSFGSELVVAPFVWPRDPDTRLSRAVAWLPQDGWYGFFDGRYYSSGWQPIYGSLGDIPVFAKPGAIVPLGPLQGWDGIGNPNELTVIVFPGADNQFDLYEDDGVSGAYLKGAFQTTSFSSKWHENELLFRIDPPQDDPGFAPPGRSFRLVLRGLLPPERIEIYQDGGWQPLDGAYDAGTHSLSLPPLGPNGKESLQVRLRSDVLGLAYRETGLSDQDFFHLLKSFRLGTEAKRSIYTNRQEIQADPGQLEAYLPALTHSQLRLLLELLTGAGVEHITSTGEELLVVWNNRADPTIALRVVSEILPMFDPQRRFPHESGIAPRFRAFHPQADFRQPTLVELMYGNLLKEEFRFSMDRLFPRTKEDL